MIIYAAILIAALAGICAAVQAIIRMPGCTRDCAQGRRCDKRCSA